MFDNFKEVFKVSKISRRFLTNVAISGGVIDYLLNFYFMDDLVGTCELSIY